MFITVAGNKKEVSNSITISELIANEKIDNPEYVTVTVNDEFMKSENFESTELKEDDIIEFLYFMGGGSF